MGGGALFKKTNLLIGFFLLGFSVILHRGLRDGVVEGNPIKTEESEEEKEEEEEEAECIIAYLLLVCMCMCVYNSWA